MARTSMLHLRVDDDLKAQANEALSSVGLTLSDAVRILLTRIASEGGLPVGLTANPETYDVWFRDKVQEALVDPAPTTPHDSVIGSLRERIAAKRDA